MLTHERYLSIIHKVHNYLINFFSYLKLSPPLACWSTFLVLLVGISILSGLITIILKYYVFKLDKQMVDCLHTNWFAALIKNGFAHRLLPIVPALVIYETISLVTDSHYVWTQKFSVGVRRLAAAYILLLVMRFSASLLDAINDHYQTLKVAKQYSIRGYLQILKIALWFFTAVLIVAVLLNKSPWVFFASLGALSAVLMLVFKDTILGFVASIQLSVYNMVRVGDWITMPKYGLDGDVLDISINMVKVRNFDKTIVTVPTHALMSDGVQNWRGMKESGGRRIKRSIYIDLDTIKFCDQQMLDRLSKLYFLQAYLPEHIQEIKQYNQRHGFDDTSPVNGRSLTNIGLFRVYIENYLRYGDKIHKQLTFTIRQLQPTETGLPLQIYVFTNDINWVRYENIQSDIFDHLLASLPLFDLRAFQLLSSHSKI